MLQHVLRSNFGVVRMGDTLSSSGTFFFVFWEMGEREEGYPPFSKTLGLREFSFSWRHACWGDIGNGCKIFSGKNLVKGRKTLGIREF